MPEHTAHRPTRVVSRSDNGRCAFGCEHPGCSFTEVRGCNQPSPVMAQREARRTRSKQRGGS
jgi:hypothetical protein